MAQLLVGKVLICLAKGLLYTSAAVVGAVGGHINIMSKVGKQRNRDTGFAGISDKVIAYRLNDLELPKVKSKS